MGEDFEDQFEIVENADAVQFGLHSITIEDLTHCKYVIFDDSGVQDWAFVALLPQLDGEDPSFRPRTE